MAFFVHKFLVFLTEKSCLILYEKHKKYEQYLNFFTQCLKIIIYIVIIA